jgi:eukaryotic-like serine/threonine-protein kinase
MLNVHTESLGLPEIIEKSIHNISVNIDINSFSGKGANGYLFFGENTILKKQIAIKYYYWGEEEHNHAEPEYLASVSNDYILKIHHAERIDRDWAYFITDFCRNGDLDEYTKKTKPFVNDALSMITNLLSGLSTLHSVQLVHRDLKPQNILIDDKKRLVIGDFGSVSKLPDGEVSIPGSKHTILYRPPEAFLSGTYSFKSDIYQIGVIMYQLLGGYLSYKDTDYLTSKQILVYNNFTDDCDRNMFVDSILKGVITKGMLINLSSLPCWTSKRVLSIIKKATNKIPDKRYPSCTDMMNDIAKAKKQSFNWCVDNDMYLLDASTMYRICPDEAGFIVQKRKHSTWRNDNSFDTNGSQSALVAEIHRRLS